MVQRLYISLGASLEDVVTALLEAKANGEHRYYEYEGHFFLSDTVTMDYAFQTVYGMTKQEYDLQNNFLLNNKKTI